jgi:ABC-type transport system substrate-binding protein
MGRTAIRSRLSWAGLGLLLASSSALAQEIKDVPRERTLISQGWDFYNQVPSPTNFSPYIGILLHQRNSLHYTVSEFLFYTNYNTGELIPWQAESFAYNDDKTEITIKIRDGVRWADGKPFTAADVVFTADMLKSVAPDLLMSSAIKEWIAKAEAVDPLTVKLTLTKPGPALRHGLPGPGHRLALHHPAQAHLGRAGSAHLRLLRSGQGPAARHRPLQAGEERFRLDHLRPPRRLVGGRQGPREGDAGHRAHRLQAGYRRGPAAALHQ